MTRPIVFKTSGFKEVSQMLKEIAPREANNLMRATIFGIAQEVRDDAKQRVPTRTGTLKKAIKAVRRRSRGSNHSSELRVHHGPNAKHDGFYWRFVEYGSGGPVPQGESPFIRPAAQKASANFESVIRRQFYKKLEQRLKRLARQQAKARG